MLLLKKFLQLGGLNRLYEQSAGTKSSRKLCREELQVVSAQFWENLLQRQTNNLVEGDKKMCKIKSAKGSSSVLLSALVVVATVLLPIENAIGQACSPDIACGPVITPATGSKVRVGDTITINFVKAGLTASSCAIRNGATYLQYPDNSGQAQVMAGFSLNPNSEIDCSGAAGLPGGDSSCLAYTTTYKIKASDVGIDLTLLLPRKGLQTAHGTAKQIHFYAAAEGDAFRADGTSGGLGYGEGIPFLTVINPCLTITKECD